MYRADRDSAEARRRDALRGGAARLPDRPDVPGVVWIGPTPPAQAPLPDPQHAHAGQLDSGQVDSGHPDRARTSSNARSGPRIGERLVASGALAGGDLVRALALQARQDLRLGEILLSHRMISESSLTDALCDQWRARSIDLSGVTPDARLVALIGAERCLALGLLPLARKGAATLVATGRPEAFSDVRGDLEAALGPVLMVLAPERDIAAAVARAASPQIARSAEMRTPARLSCRGWRANRAAWAIGTTLAALTLALVFAPIATLVALTSFGMATLLPTALLKGLALGQALRRRAAHRVPQRVLPAGRDGPAPARRLPVISVLVPLLREADITTSLIARLSRLRYPRELTDIVILVEAEDLTTRSALAQTRLPGYMRVLIVPPGTVKTKPRALNYGLSFARGRIVGIWDAEDKPHPDQLHVVAAHFATCDPRVACIQGALDFYNTRTNWIARCFTLEYATWFRAFLPGLQGLDLPIPLGGTTLFFRRHALEDLGGWDAHNVTEDADLGIRLYRAGYRTEIADTVTEEEANCRLLPWIRQRSRWLKGYAMTYAVHMRAPRALWREMGPRGFAGFQTLFVGTLTQFLLAPILISLWILVILGGHPVMDQVPSALGWAFLALVIASEAISIGLSVTALAGTTRARLLWWLPALQVYFPLASLAAYRGVWEMLSRPFYWDKTEHGLHGADPADPAPPSIPRSLPAGPAPQRRQTLPQ